MLNCVLSGDFRIADHLPKPLFTEFHSALGVHVEQADCGPPCGCQADDVSASHHEVIAPNISTRIEQGHERARIGIDAREVWSFAGVTAVTGEREAARIVRATVLPRHDMLDMERNQRCRLLRHAAKLTHVPSTPSNNLP